MPKSRNRKNHKSKLNVRNGKISDAKKAMDKARTRILEELIAKEQKSGAFDTNKSVDDIIGEMEGPQI